MKRENIIDYTQKTYRLNKDLSEYLDIEKGVKYPIPTIQLLPQLEKLELTDDELKKKTFEMEIEKGIEFNKIKVNRPYPKYKDTQKEEDKNIIIDKEFEVNEIWNIRNTLGLVKTFNNKEEALKIYDELKELILIRMGD